MNQIYALIQSDVVINTIMWDGTQELSQIPVRRDVMLVNTNSSTVWRFKANNPGIFLIHW